MPLIDARAHELLAMLGHKENGRVDLVRLRLAARTGPPNWSIEKRYVEVLDESGDTPAAIAELKSCLTRQWYRAESWQLLSELPAKRATLLKPPKQRRGRKHTTFIWMSVQFSGWIGRSAHDDNNGGEAVTANHRATGGSERGRSLLIDIRSSDYAESAIQCTCSPISRIGCRDESRFQRWWVGVEFLGRCPRLLMNAAPLANRFVQVETVTNVPGFSLALFPVGTETLGSSLGGTCFCTFPFIRQRVASSQGRAEAKSLRGKPTLLARLNRY